MGSVTEQVAREAAKSMQFLKDAATSHELSILAKWAVVELDRRDAERAERLRSIDIDWLSTLGESIRDDKNAFGVRINENCTAVIYSPTAILSALKQGPLTLVHVTVGRDRLSVDVKTRGELLDWAKMAKGGAS